MEGYGRLKLLPTMELNFCWRVVSQVLHPTSRRKKTIATRVDHQCSDSEMVGHVRGSNPSVSDAPIMTLTRLLRYLKRLDLLSEAPLMPATDYVSKGKEGSRRDATLS